MHWAPLKHRRHLMQSEMGKAKPICSLKEQGWVFKKFTRLQSLSPVEYQCLFSIQVIFKIKNPWSNPSSIQRQPEQGARPRANQPVWGTVPRHEEAVGRFGSSGEGE